MSSLSESNWWYLSRQEVKSLNTTTWFRIWHFQTLPQKRYLWMHLLAARFVFWWWWLGFSEWGSHDLSDGQRHLSTRQLHICLHIYSLWLFLALVNFLGILHTSVVNWSIRFTLPKLLFYCLNIPLREKRSRSRTSFERTSAMLTPWGRSPLPSCVR